MTAAAATIPAPDVDLMSPASFAFQTVENLRFADVDANGHVNNVAFLVFFENARVSFIQRHLPFMRREGLAVVVARLEIDFRAQMHFPGSIRAGARLLEIGRSSFGVGQAIFDQHGKCAATGRATIVAFDREAGKARQLPPEIRADLARMAASPGGAPAEG